MKLRQALWFSSVFVLPMVHGAEPQATPVECVLVAQGGVAKAEKNGSFDLEKCLIKAGNKNFSRKGKVLTVFWSGGKKAVFKNTKQEDGDSAYTYGGYDPVSGLHRVHYYEDNPEWPAIGFTLLDQDAGMYGNVSGDLPMNAVSSDRRWVLSSRNCGMDSCNITDSIGMYKLPARGERGKIDEVELILPNDVAEEQRFQLNGEVILDAVEWSSTSMAQLDISCRKDKGRVEKDRVSLMQEGMRWRLERTPCVTSASRIAKAAPSAPSATSKVLRVGMTLDEVEKFFGRSADGYKINPLALLGKKEVTRVWKNKGSQIEVVFVADVVTAWH